MEKKSKEQSKSKKQKEEDASNDSCITDKNVGPEPSYHKTDSDANSGDFSEDPEDSSFSSSASSSD